MTEAPGPSSRKKILEVAEARFAQRGYAGVGLREVAEAAGLSKSSLFHHFPSKAALYCSMLDGVLLRLEARLGAALGAQHAPPVRLEAGLDELISVLAEQPTTARLLLRALFEDNDLPGGGLPESEAVNASLARVIAAIQSVIEAGVADGSFRPVSVPHTVQTLVGTCVYPFASGEFGDELLGRPIFSAEAVRARREEVRAFVHFGLARQPDSAPKEKAS